MGAGAALSVLSGHRRDIASDDVVWPRYMLDQEIEF
jgi:hypothetical protein